MAEYFMSYGLSVSFIELPEKDPSDLGFDKITNILNNSNILSNQKILEYKINEY